jgi:endo-1,4-beta-D-glucanase Y
MSQSTPTSNYPDKNGILRANRIALSDPSNPSATGTIQLYTDANGNLSFFNAVTNQAYTLTTTPVTPSGNGGNGGGNGTSTPPTTIPPTSVFQDGNLIFNAPATASLPTPFSEVKGPAGTTTVAVVGGKYQFNLQGAPGQEVGLGYNAENQLIRRIRFKLNVSAGMVINNENTIMHVWDKPSAGGLEDFFQIRLNKEYKQNTANGNLYNLVFKIAGAGGFANPSTTVSKRLYVPFQKGTEYHLELYMTDSVISLTDLNQTSGYKTPLMWFDNSPISYAFFNFSGKYFDNLFFGEFYGGNAAGQFTLDDIQLYQDYVYPIVPATNAGKVADAYAGWKARYLLSSGGVIKHDGSFPFETESRPQIVSEAQAYGMMFAAQMNDQPTFNLIHNYNQTYLRRDLPVNGSQTTNPKSLGWLADPISNLVTDTSGAPDAEVDIALAYIWAHEKWGSAGTVNYSAMANQVLADLKTYSFIDFQGGKIVDGGSWNYPSGNTRQINISYQSPGSFKKFKDFTNDTFWDLARNGSYSIATASGDATLRGQVGAGIIPDWVQVNGSNNQISDPQSNGYSVNHKYDAFRFEHRAYWDFLWTNNPQFTTFANYKLKQVYTTGWNSLGFIQAERYHNNAAGYPNVYPNTIFTTKAWYVLNASPASPVAGAVAATISPTALYKPHPTGAYFGGVGYFGESWDLIHQMTQSNLWRYINS